MKTRFYILFALIIAGVQVFAQQCGTRYVDSVFHISKTTVTYSNVWSDPLTMDIYQPVGDTASIRPVVILAHGGSFIPPTDRTDDATIIELATNFAKRGYVTASIDYRIDSTFIGFLDSAYAVIHVLRAISDGKAAIRYFRKDAYTSNTFKIDTNTIFIGGNSAGAVLFDHVAYIDSVSQTGTAFQAVINANGGLEGNSGNPGYSSRVNGLINCAGGLNNPDFIGAGSLPSANFQGDQDVTVPYNCGDPESGQAPVRLCGLGAMEGYYTQFGVNHVSVVYPGEAHVPWETGTHATTEMHQVDSVTASFLYSLLSDNYKNQTVCVSSINNVADDPNVKAFPNPASNELTFSFKDVPGYEKIQLFDETGRLITEKNVLGERVNFERGDLTPGIYFAKVLKKDSSYSIKKVVFE